MDRVSRMIHPAAVLVVVSLVFFAAFVSPSDLGQITRENLGKEDIALILRSIAIEALEGDFLDNLSNIVTECSNNVECRDAVIKSNGEAIVKRFFEGTAEVFHIKEFGSVVGSLKVKRCLPPFGKRMWPLEYAEALAAVFKSDSCFVSYFLSAYQEGNMIFDLINGTTTDIRRVLDPFLKTLRDDSERALVLYWLKGCWVYSNLRSFTDWSSCVGPRNSDMLLRLMNWILKSGELKARACKNGIELLLANLNDVNFNHLLQILQNFHRDQKRLPNVSPITEEFDYLNSMTFLASEIFKLFLSEEEKDQKALDLLDKLVRFMNKDRYKLHEAFNSAAEVFEFSSISCERILWLLDSSFPLDVKAVGKIVSPHSREIAQRSKINELLNKASIRRLVDPVHIAGILFDCTLVQNANNFEASFLLWAPNIHILQYIAKNHHDDLVSLVNSWLQAGNARFAEYLDLIVRFDLIEDLKRDSVCKFLSSLRAFDLRARLAKYLIVECEDFKMVPSFVRFSVTNESIFTEIVELIMLLPEQDRPDLAAECLRLTSARDKVSRALPNLPKDVDFASFFNLFLLGTPKCEQHDILPAILRKLLFYECEKANDQFVSFLSKYPEWFEFQGAGFLLSSLIELKLATVNIQDLFLSICNHSVLLESGFVDEGEFLNVIISYMNDNPEIQISSDIMNKFTDSSM